MQHVTQARTELTEQFCQSTENKHKTQNQQHKTLKTMTTYLARLFLTLLLVQLHYLLPHLLNLISECIIFLNVVTPSTIN